MNNKWIRGAIQALLIHCSIGTVYCWSLLRNAICNTLEITHSSIEWAFSLAIFFLGMSAAFCGNHLGNYLLVNYSPTILFIVLSVLYLTAASITYLFINKWKN